MDVFFRENKIEIEMKLKGMSKEIQYDILHYLQDAVDREKGLQAKKVKNLTTSFNEGYNELSSEEKGLHHPESEYEQAYKDAFEEEEEEDADPEEKKEKPPASTATFVNGNGKRVYQLWYICDSPRCDGKGKRFVPKGAVFTKCHKCGKENLKVRNAVDDDKFGIQDRYNNYYIAGKFKRDDERTFPFNNYENVAN